MSFSQFKKCFAGPCFTNYLQDLDSVVPGVDYDESSLLV